MTNSYSEDILAEQPAIALFETLEGETANCYCETFGHASSLAIERVYQHVHDAFVSQGLSVYERPVVT